MNQHKRKDKSRLDISKYVWSYEHNTFYDVDLLHQVVIETEDQMDFPKESGFAVDDIMLADCMYPEPVGPGECPTGYSQCVAGECFRTFRWCDFAQDCCDNTDEDKQSCRTSKPSQ